MLDTPEMLPAPVPEPMDPSLALPVERTTSLPLDRHPVAVLLASKTSTHSRRSYASSLDQIAALVSRLTGTAFSKETLPWWLLRYPHVARIKAELARDMSPASANVRLSHLRSVLRECRRLGLMTAEDHLNAVDVGPVRGSRVPRGRSLTPGEIDALVRNCGKDKGPAGVRDAAVIALCYTCGLRRAEVVAIDLEDIDPETGQVKVHGKGNRERLVYLANGGLDAVRDWIVDRGDAPGPILYRIRKGGRIESERLTEQAIYDLLRRRAKRAGVKDFSPHDCRRTLAGNLLDRGVDISTVSRMLGHAQIGTTARYDRRPEEAKRVAATAIHIPYRRRHGCPGNTHGQPPKPYRRQ